VLLRSLGRKISIEVSDIDALDADALARKLRIDYPMINEPCGVGRFFVVDPNGAIINIISHRQAQP
jgi:predicted enzyme related to lactoylglutathione lyase